MIPILLAGQTVAVKNILIEKKKKSKNYLENNPKWTNVSADLKAHATVTVPWSTCRKPRTSHRDMDQGQTRARAPWASTLTQAPHT